MFTSDTSRMLFWLNIITDAYGETVPSGWDTTLNVILLMADFGRAPSPPHIPTQHVSLLEVPTFPTLYPWEQMAAPFLCRHARLFVHAWCGALYPQLYNLCLLWGRLWKRCFELQRAAILLPTGWFCMTRSGNKPERWVNSLCTLSLDVTRTREGKFMA